MKILGFIPIIILLHYFAKKLKKDKSFRSNTVFLLEVVGELVLVMGVILVTISGLLWALS